MPTVILGYMDEEASPPLDEIMAQARRAKRPVYVVERAPYIGGELFERKVNTYGGGAEISRDYSIVGYNLQDKSMHRGGSVGSRVRKLPDNLKSEEIMAITGNIAQMSSDIDDYYASNPSEPPRVKDPFYSIDVFAHALRRRLDNEQFSDKLHREAVFNKEKKIKAKTTLEHPRLSVYQLQEPDTDLLDLNYDDPIFLVRAPEMGLQPSATRTYLDAIFGSINDAGLGKSGIDLGVYGAGGSITPTLNPGDKSDIDSSFYVGSEFDEQSGKHRPTIKFLSMKDGKEHVIWKGDSMDFPGDADKIAGQVFVGSILGEGPKKEYADYLKHEQWYYDEDKKESFKAGVDYKSIGYRIRSTCQQYEPKQTSITASFFVGKDIKEAGGKLGLGGSVNMEDFHTLSTAVTLKERKRLRGFHMRRLNCDPYAINDTILSSFEGMKTKDVPLEYYRQAILWGLDGSPLDKIPKHADWRATQDREWGVDPKLVDDKELGKHFYKSKDGKVFDPFFGEVASDFLATLANEKDSPFGADDKVSDEVQKGLQQKAKSLLKGPLPQDKTREDVVDELLAEFSTIEAFKGKDKKHLKMWTRRFKWKDSPDTAQLGKINFKEERNGNADRALYKSSNRLALKDKAKSFFVDFDINLARDKADDLDYVRLTRQLETELKAEELRKEAEERERRQKKRKDIQL